jgi:uncharacterized membrane protein YphA (DoxX/SURF4 family)
MSVDPTPVPVPTPTTPAWLSAILDKLLGFLSGYKTYLAALGLFGMALYQVFVAKPPDYVGAYTNVMAALAAVGLRHAVAKAASGETPT